MVIRKALLTQYNVNDVLHKHKDKPSQPTHTVPKKDVILVLPYLRLHSDAINKFYGFVNLGVVYRTLAELSLSFLIGDRFNRSQKSKFVYKASCWDCDAFTSEKLKKDYMIERLSTSKLSLKLVTPPLLLSIRFPPVTTSNETILRS